MFKTVLVFALNAAVATAHPEWTAHVCGAYCGPGWCNGKYLEENKCSGTHPVETHSLTGPSCADQCCQRHDMCCGHSKNRRPCNGDLENCLSKCNALSLTCTKDDVPVPAGAIWAAMKLFSGDCCSGPCTSAENIALDEAHGSTANKTKTKSLFLPKTVSEYKTLAAQKQPVAREIDVGSALKPDPKRTSNNTNNTNNTLSALSGCMSRSTAVSRAIQGAHGAYVQAVCGHLGPYRCDCSGLVSYVWGLPPPGAVTQTMQHYCNADVKWTGLKPGDAILHPNEPHAHVLIFVSWNGPVGGDSFIQAACHDPKEGCSHGLGSLSYYKQLGFFPCRAHPDIVCP